MEKLHLYRKTDLPIHCDLGCKGDAVVAPQASSQAPKCSICLSKPGDDIGLIVNVDVDGQNATKVPVLGVQVQVPVPVLLVSSTKRMANTDLCMFRCSCRQRPGKSCWWSTRPGVGSRHTDHARVHCSYTAWRWWSLAAPVHHASHCRWIYNHRGI